MTRGARVAAAALALVGVRFRLHGRDPGAGLDCVGLAALALRAGGWVGEVPSGYALRGGDPARIAAALGDAMTTGSGTAPGELRLFTPGPAQLHLAIGIADGVVHADATLRRVVARPGPAPWPLQGAWRLLEDGEANGWRR